MTDHSDLVAKLRRMVPKDVGATYGVHTIAWQAADLIEAQERAIAEAERNMETILAADFNLQTELAALQHDIAQYVQRDSDRLREIEDLRSQLIACEQELAALYTEVDSLREDRHGTHCP